MASLGILVTNLHQEEDYFTLIAKEGMKKNVPVYLFSPMDIDHFNHTARGLLYCEQKNRWIEDVYPLPNYIYDRCFYETEEVYQNSFSQVSWLKSQPTIHFLGHGLPNKWVVQKALKEDPLIQLVLPKTELLSTSKEFLSLLDQHHSILLKPVSGSQGKGIFILSKGKSGFSLTAKKNGEPYVKSITRKQMIHLLTKVGSKRKYLLQPFLQLLNNERRPFDIRIFLQKNGKGQWKEIGRGIRTGKIGDYTSNIGSGGEVHSYDEWLRFLPIDAQNELEQLLGKLRQRIPTVLEQHGHELFELGLDFGFDMKGKLWLLEVNSKPGRKVITTSFPFRKTKMAQATIDYCRLLESRKKGVGI